MVDALDSRLAQPLGALGRHVADRGAALQVGVLGDQFRPLDDFLEVAFGEALALGDHAEAVGARCLGGARVLEDLLGLHHRVHRRVGLGIAGLGTEAAVLGAAARLGVDQRAHVGRVAEVLLAHRPGALDQLADLLMAAQLAERQRFLEGDQRGHCGARLGAGPDGWPVVWFAGVTAAMIRRRRLVAGVVCGLAAGAFVLGAALGDGPVPRPSAASELTPAQLAGQRIVLGFSGTRPPSAAVRLIREGSAAGVILFSDNLPSRAVGRRLIHRLQAIKRPSGLGDPLLVMTDQEGGLVKRVGGAPTASAEGMAARGPAFSRAQGRDTAVNLRSLGINVDLAPVLDVARPGGTIAATDRGFGSTAAEVAGTAVPFAEGLQAGGVAATAKHFPGLGAARLNTDDAVQRIELPESTLRAVDETPYKRFAAAAGEMVMLSTAIYPALSNRPAAFSRKIATDELRSRIGFEGVSITDALDTVAVRAFGNTPKAARAAATAGVDLLLFTSPNEAAQAHRSLLRGLRNRTLSRPSFEASADRVLRLRHGLGSSG